MANENKAADAAKGARKGSRRIFEGIQGICPQR